jgi:thermitase
MVQIAAKCCLRFVSLIIFSFSILYAGNQYTANPGEEVAPGELIVAVKSGVNVAALVPNYGLEAKAAPLGHLNVYVLTGTGNWSANAIANLAHNPSVEYVEPNRKRHVTALAAPNDTFYSSQWALQTMQALQAWGVIPANYLTSLAAGNGSGRIKVAVLDTGVDCTHPDFINTGGTSTDSAQGGQLLWSASQAIVPTAVTNPTCAWQDDYGHGTHVAGIIAAAASNATGVAGVGYPLQVMVFKVLDSSGSGYDSYIAAGIMAAADAGAQVISLSLGESGYSQTLQAAVNYAWQHNALVVAAAGNSSSNSLFFPAGANYAVGVSATDNNNALASFSDFGSYVKIAGPGVSILSDAPTYPVTTGWNNYVTLSGTSMSTPHVAAVAGLVAMTTPGTSAAAILQRIQQTASSTTVGGGWNQDFGYGIVNAYNAVTGTLRSSANGALAGQIVDTTSQPVQGATVTVAGSTITTDSSGLYQFPLAAGTYPISVMAAGFTTQNLTATVAAGADTILTVIMSANYARFTGTVKDAGVPVAGAIVQALSSGLIEGTAVADTNGLYTLWIPAGTYDIRASSVGYSNSTVSAQAVAAGGGQTVNLVMPKLGSILGVVRDPSNHPIANAQINVAGSSTVAAVTDSNGNYSTIGLPSGTYSVTGSASNFLPSTVSNVMVAADAPAPVNLSLSSTSSSTNSAQFVKTDTTTQGTWSGVYGANGYNVIDGTTAYPSTLTVTPSGQSNWIWSSSTADTRALQLAPLSSSRIAATWYTPTSFTIDLVFSDTAQHQLAIYSVDWDHSSRAQTLSILDGTSNAVLDSRSVTHFDNTGEWVVWNVSGHVIVKVTNNGPVNAVISGLFLAGSTTNSTPVAAPAFNLASGTYTSAQSVTVSTTTAGASIRYTTDGSTPNETAGTVYSGSIAVNSSTTIRAIAFAAGMTDSAVASATYTINAPASTPVAAPTFSPGAGTYTSAQSVTIGTTTGGASIRYTTDGSTPSETAGTVYSRPIAVSSSMTIKAIAYAAGMADSAVVSAAYTINLVSASNSAQFVKTDTTTQGSWSGVYGASGYNVIDGTTSYPSNVTVTPSNQLNYIWSSSTTDARALQLSPLSGTRIAATWYTYSSFNIDMAFSDTAQHRLAIYCLDWDELSRSQTISILDGTSNAVLDSRSVTNFSAGEWVVWNVSGHVIVQVSNTGPNAVISGLFFN